MLKGDGTILTILSNMYTYLSANAVLIVQDVNTLTDIKQDGVPSFLLCPAPLLLSDMSISSGCSAALRRYTITTCSAVHLGSTC